MVQANPISVISIYFIHAIALIFLFPPKYKWPKAVAIWGAMIAIFSLLCFILFYLMPNYIGMALALTITAAMGVITSLKLSSYEISKTLFLFFTYSHLFVIILYSSKVLSLYFFENSQATMIMVRTLLHLVLVALCIAFVRYKFRKISQGVAKGWWPLNFVIMLMFVYSGSFAVHSFTEGYTGNDVFSFFIMVLITIAVYWLFFHTIYYMNVAKETEKMELQDKFLMRQVADMQESIETAKQIRHDARHHNLQIMEYAQRGEIDALLRYLGQLENDAQSHVAVTLCENHAVNTILSAYMKKAEQQGIDVRLSVMLKQGCIISDTDLVAILANLMENAIHGCVNSQKEKPFIELNLGQKETKLVIYIKILPATM